MIGDAEYDDLQCKVCGAHATGFHFNAQSCSACCAFFRRAISLKRVYKCERVKSSAGAGPQHNDDDNDAAACSASLCVIAYTERKLCRACRLRKCFAVGMNKSCVQGPKSLTKQMRAYCTNSGLRRNKRFSVISNVNNTVWRREYGSSRTAFEQTHSTPTFSENVCGETIVIQHNNDDCNFIEDGAKTAMYNTEIVQPTGATNSNNGCYVETSAKPNNEFNQNLEAQTPTSRSSTSSSPLLSSSSAPSTSSALSTPNLIRQPTPPAPNLLRIFIMEEMKIAERRRILFCERPIGTLLGNTKHGPFTISDIKPLDFHEFRRSIRIHILLIYEWLRVCPYYERLCKQDQLTFLRKSVLYHTILDPCFITLQVGDLSKFVLQNGGYVSTVAESDEGWHDEREISRDNKKKIYGPLLKRLMSDIITQMVELGVEFEEFVALKALVSIQMTICDASSAGRIVMKQASGEICQALYEDYQICADLEKATRLGNILLLLSPIFDTATNFVESHHQVQFFDLWQIDSLLLQFLKNKV